MTSADQQRKTDNEAVFRMYNEAVMDGFDNLRMVADREGWSSDIRELDDPLHFYCECSNEDCKERIMVRPSVYGAIHKNRKRFTIRCGHETLSVESVVDETSAYCVVEKFRKPDEDARELERTS